MTAALFVLPDGPYAGLLDVEVWDKDRDARLYPGPWPATGICQRLSKRARALTPEPFRDVLLTMARTVTM